MGGAFRLWLLVLAVLVGAARADAACTAETYEGNDYTVCRFDLRQDHLQLFSLDDRGEPFGSFNSLELALEPKGQTLAFAMNAGMYGENLKPIGLYIENGRTLRKLNRRDGPGNFHMKPNGVFYIDGAKSGVIETEAFAAAGLHPQFASQSGPMLVVDGEIHPRFSPDGTSLQRRNGVGAPDGHTLVFVISEDWVNFHSFARLFKDRLNCPNALFLDGSISSLHAPDMGRSDGFAPLGPIVALVKGP
ncbi:MAG: phosphodiester glycosidase family protein [Aestuariivirga sp.]|uniref:phosphodiester glycosidase family protein n=1 Tax=Aestuariivirga sp. TaxID=2650926 RepID=UPI0025C17489|nr:phosphodiester glycosidase family protein [Aestuariivirga sp.]MCA3560089.1 phosphodiester glycosidase family protein [Aestuariivirga sp.]